MAFDFRYPTTTGATEQEQLAQMRSYIIQLVDELRWALNSVDTQQVNYVVVQEKNNIVNSGAAAMSVDVMHEDSVQAHFNEIKPLIIKSAEIIEAYYEEINTRLESLYVAQSDFGTFAEKTSQDIEATSESTTQQFNNMQVVITEIGSEVGSLENALLNISEEFSYTQRDIVEINSNIQTIDEEVVALSSGIVDLDGEVKAVEETVGAIDSELKTVEENVGALDTNLKNVEGNVGQLDTELQGVKTGVQTITEEVGKVDTELKGVKTEVQTVSQEVSNVGTVLQGVKTDVQGVATEVDGVKTEVDGVKSGVQEVAAEVEDAKTGVQNVANEVENVKSSVGSNLQVIAEDIDKVGSDLEGLKENTEANIQGINESLGAVGNDLDKVDSELQGFKEDTSQDLNDIKDEIENIKYIIVDVNAYIKSGLLYSDANGLPVYGLEIGQRNNVNGVEIFNKFARFTSDRLSFYDQNDIEVAYISDKKLYISDVEVLRSFKIGGIKKIVLANGDVVTKWVGGEG